jgi:HD superfamily phosphohydrolase
MTEVKANFDRLSGYYALESYVPELNPQLGTTTQIPGNERVPFTKRIRELVEHPSMARLSQFNQLGLDNLLYMGASHTRLEHSLGTFANACRYIRALYYDECNPLFQSLISVEDIERILLASLLHDVGQYPLCHDIEEVLGKFQHEHCLKLLLDGEIKQKLPDDFKPIGQLIQDSELWRVKDIRKISRLTSGETSSSNLSFCERILRAVLDSPIDIDKTDYLQRDSIHCGVPYGQALDFERLLKCLTVAYNFDTGSDYYVGIGIHSKGRISAEAVAWSRYAMFKAVYWHHFAREVKAMISFIILNTMTNEQREKEFEEHIFTELRSVEQAPLFMTVGEFTKEPMIGAQINEAEKRILQWLAEKNEIGIRELVNCLLTRKIYKRLIQIEWGDDEDLYNNLKTIRLRGMSQVEECRKKLEAEIIAKLQGLNLVSGKDLDDYASMKKPPLILLDIPWREWGSQEIYCFYERENKFKRLSQLSPVWQALHTSFNEALAVFSIFVHPKAEDTLRKEIGIDVVYKFLKQVACEEYGKVL